jgi:hypothetical protein
VAIGQTKAIKIFYCYAQEDDALRKELEKHLSPLRRLRQVTGWFSRDILAGANWADEMETQLNTASIILLLISPDFMASDYCYSVEMQRALERHRTGKARVIPIILRPVLWEDVPINELQLLPTTGKHVTQWINRDEAFLNVARAIRDVVRMLLSEQILSERETMIIEKIGQEIYPSCIDSN